MIDNSSSMGVFIHHIYEYKKGLRSLVLHTTSSLHREFIEAKLSSKGISHIIVPVTRAKINVFFGDPDCIGVLKSFDTLDLSSLTDEQDFILGTLLGYNLGQQCQRFLKRKSERMEEPLNWPKLQKTGFQLVRGELGL
ncbi:hypothetical protein CHISP_0323 [Chitinispirillum alkaliphilum]|nr:hypothetical protein CHISP_0323 [Chitinispirillum alkaliphilum]